MSRRTIRFRKRRWKRISGNIIGDKKIFEQRPDKEEQFFAKLDQTDHEKKKLRNRRLEQDNRQSEEYASRAYKFARIWVIFIPLLIIFQFIGRSFHYGLEKEEFIVVVGSLTTSIFGFWYLVGRHLFPFGKEKDD